MVEQKVSRTVMKEVLVYRTWYGFYGGFNSFMKCTELEYTQCPR